jgi:hypothetical protein
VLNKLNEGVGKKTFNLIMGEGTAVQLCDEALYRLFVMVEILLELVERDGHDAIANGLIIYF